MVTRRVVTAEEHVLARISVTPGNCWVWTRSRNQWGYGKCCFVADDGRRLSLAHRLSYETFVGPIPSGLTLDHLCRNRSCVNPAHLEPVTIGENTRRSAVTRASINKAKTHCPQGHEYDAVRKAGWRACRTCQAEANRRHRTKQESA